MIMKTLSSLVIFFLFQRRVGVKKVNYLLSMIMNLSNFYFDSVSIFTHFTKHWIFMYERLIIAYILNNAMHAYNFFRNF